MITQTLGINCILEDRKQELLGALGPSPPIGCRIDFSDELNDLYPFCFCSSY